VFSEAKYGERKLLPSDLNALSLLLYRVSMKTVGKPIEMLANKVDVSYYLYNDSVFTAKVWNHYGENHLKTKQSEILFSEITMRICNFPLFLN
jgi:hypothetical protein